MAAYNGHSDCVKILLMHNADVKLKNSYNKTPIEAAIDQKHTDAVIELLKHKR